MDEKEWDETHRGMRTSAILADPDYLRDLATMRRLNPWVSLRSRFNQVKWVFDNDPPCQLEATSVVWDDVPPRLAAELKILVLRQGAAGPLGSGQSVDTCCTHAYGAIPLGRWMATERLRGLADLGAGGGDAFLHALAEKVREIGALDSGESLDGWDPRLGGMATFGRGSRLTRGKVKSVAVFLLSARAHADALTALGIRPLETPPFLIGATGRKVANGGVGRRNQRYADGGVTPTSVADAFGDLKKQVKERIPDAVRYPMLDAFERLLGIPAEENLRLIGRLLGQLATGITENEAIERLAGHRFGMIGGEDAPWREPLPASAGGSVLRRLVRDVVAPAGAIVLDATGMRPSEFVMLDAGRRRRTLVETRLATSMAALRTFSTAGPGEPAVPRLASLPACVSETLSVSGLTVMVYLHGRVYKHKKRPVEAYWLLGSRQDEAPDPLAVRALDLLERLSRLLRPFAGDDDAGRLLLQIASRPDEPLRCSGMTIGRLQQDVPTTVRRYVDLSGIGTVQGIYDLRRYTDSQGGCVSLYQFRRTFVQLAYRTEPRLLVPLARQLKHDHSAVTKRAYVTSDPTLLRELEEAHSRETVAMFRETVEGKRRLAGNMGDRIEAFAAEVRDRMLELPADERDDFVARAFRVHDYRIHFLDDVVCMIGLRPGAALCNRSSGRAGFKVDEPDLSIRDGTMCASCANGCFDRDRHGASILRRLVNNRTVYARQSLTGRGHLYGAWRRRAERDEALLTKLGVPFPSEKEIIHGLA